MEHTLRPWALTDIPSVAKHANNPRIACFLRDVFPHPYTASDAEGYVQMCIQNEQKAQLCRAIVIGGEAVGSIGVFVGSDVYRKSAELGYWLAEPYWGQGIMRHAVREICAQAFRQFDIVRIYAEPFAHNIGSRRVLEHAGFTLEGVMKNGVCKGGQLHDYCMYALLKVK